MGRRSKVGWRAARRALRAQACPDCGHWADPDLPIGHPRKLVMDHVIPLAAAPGQTYRHTRPICNLCNLRKKDRIPAGRIPGKSRQW